MTLSPFHLALPVHDLAAARAFYGDLLGCSEGRSGATWIDFNFHGHQLVCHLDPGLDPAARATRSNPVDGENVPVPHFGIVLPLPSWRELARRLRDAHAPFVIAPRIRFAGAPGEQATMFLRDPSGNAVEFKAFREPDQLFAR